MCFCVFCLYFLFTLIQWGWVRRIFLWATLVIFCTEVRQCADPTAERAAWPSSGSILLSAFINAFNAWASTFSTFSTFSTSTNLAKVQSSLQWSLQWSLVTSGCGILRHQLDLFAMLRDTGDTKGVTPVKSALSFEPIFKTQRHALHIMPYVTTLMCVFTKLIHSDCVYNCIHTHKII